MKKIIAIILTLTLSFFVLSLPVLAYESNIMPLVDDEHTVNTNFVIASNGYGEATAIYRAPTGSVQRVKVTIVIEKKFLLFFWDEIERWSATFTEPSFTYTETFSTARGTHKATFTFEVTAADGTTETFSREMETVY